MGDERLDRLKELLAELKTWPYERLKGLRAERLSRQLTLESGWCATLHAEALEEFEESGMRKLLIPVEVWIEGDVVWVHLIAGADNLHEVDLELHTNPR